jgi:hypothetical protein
MDKEARAPASAVEASAAAAAQLPPPHPQDVASDRLVFFEPHRPQKDTSELLREYGAYILKTIKIADKFLKNEPLISKLSIIDTAEGKVWKMAQYLVECVQTIERLLKRREMIAGKGLKVDDLTLKIERIISTVEDTVFNVINQEILVESLWWEETFTKVKNSGKDSETATDIILLTALAHNCILTAAVLDRGSLFNTRAVEEVYGMWVVCKSDEMRRFIETMPSFKNRVDGHAIQSHWHCNYTNQWTGVISSDLIRVSCQHPESDTKDTMDYHIKLCIEDIERTVQTRDSKFMEYVLHRVQSIPYWQRYFVNGNYGMCSLFKAMCCCIHMANFPSHPYIGTQESADNMFDTLLKAIEKMCTDLVTEPRYAISLLTVSVYCRKYDYAAKLIKHINATDSGSSLYLSGLMVVIFQARENVLERSDSDPAITFIRTFVGSHIEILDDIRNRPQYDEIMEYALLPIGKPTP